MWWEHVLARMGIQAHAEDAKLAFITLEEQHRHLELRVARLEHGSYGTALLLAIAFGGVILGLVVGHYLGVKGW